MAASETDIVNEALARIGVSPIMALSDDSKQAQFANRFYASSRDEVLAVRAWPFGIQRAILNSLTVPPISEWQYAYQLPADYVRLVQLNNDEVVNIKHKYAIEGKTLVTDAPVVSICYVAKITDVTFFSPIFVESLVLKLASKLAAPLTGAVEMGLQFLQLYDKAVMAPEVGEQSGRSKRQKDQTTTPTEIANTALGMIGAPPITSFSDASVQAQIADRLYDQTRDEVMSERAWTFAVKRATLVQTANPGGSEYAFSYALPADHLRLLQLNDDEIDIIQNKYTLEGSNLLTDAVTGKIVYVGRITDSTKYSPLFVEALTLKLAIKMFNALTDGRNPNALQVMLAGYEKAMATPQAGEQRHRAKRNKSNTITETNIANMALALLGVTPIASLADNSVQAQVADRMFAQTRDEVLSEKAWPFAIIRATLTPANNPGGSEWLHTYTLPANYVRLLQLNRDEIGTITHKFALEGDKLLTDLNPLTICYVGQVTDVTKFSPLFIEALSTKLAMKMSHALSDKADPNAMKTLMATYAKVLQTPEAGEQAKRTKRNKSGTVSPVEIANTALSLLGMSPITALTDASLPAQLADQFYEVTRDEVLMAHRWNFAIKRAVIAETTVPLSGYQHAYTLPGDHLRMLQLNGYEVDEIEDSYELEGNTLLTDYGIPDDPAPAPPAPPTHTVDIRYVARITDPTKYPPLFLEALALKLASKLAGPLTQDRNVSMQMLENYERLVIPKGRLTNAFQNRPRLRLQLVESKLVRSRRTGG